MCAGRADEQTGEGTALSRSRCRCALLEVMVTQSTLEEDRPTIKLSNWILNSKFKSCSFLSYLVILRLEFKIIPAEEDLNVGADTGNVLLGEKPNLC